MLATTLLKCPARSQPPPPQWKQAAADLAALPEVRSCTLVPEPQQIFYNRIGKAGSETVKARAHAAHRDGSRPPACPTSRQGAAGKQTNSSAESGVCRSRG